MQPTTIEVLARAIPTTLLLDMSQALRQSLTEVILRYNTMQDTVPQNLVVSETVLGQMAITLNEIDQLVTAVQPTSPDHAVLAGLSAALVTQHQLVGYLRALQDLPGAQSPPYLHFYWSGRPIRNDARDNIIAWAQLAVPAEWRVFVWTDAVKRQWSQATVAALNGAGVTINSLDKDEIDSRLWPAYQIIARAEKPNYPAASDLARYSVLFRRGGVYLDVDIAPGPLTDMSELERYVRLPLLAPEIRDVQAVRDHLHLEPGAVPTAQQVRTVATERLARGIYNGNFIMCPPRLPVMGRIIDEVAAGIDSIPGGGGAQELVEIPEAAAFVTGPAALKRAVVRYVRDTLLLDQIAPVHLVNLALNHSIELGWLTPESEEQEH